MRSTRLLATDKLFQPWQRSTPQDKERARKFKVAQAAQFFSMMADVLAVGFSIKEGLNFARIMLPRQKQQISQIQAHLISGRPFAMAVKDYVSTDCYYQIKIAEDNGALSQVLTNLGNFLAIRQRQERKIRTALRYPLGILVCLGILMGAIKQLIMPELSALSGGTSHLPSWLWGIMAVVSVLLAMTLLAVIWLKRQPRLRQVIICSRMPLIGPLLNIYWHYYLSFNLGLLLASGMQSRDVLKLLQTYQQETVLRQLADRLNRHLIFGGDIKTFIKQYRFLPASFSVFFTKGLTTTQLAKDLQADAHLTYQRLFSKIEGLIGLIQPVLFGVIGMAIVGIYLSILLPMYHAIGGLS